MDNSWFYDMENRIFSIIKAKTKSTIQADYSDVFYTNSNATPTTAHFPTIYIHLIGSPESDGTISGTTIESAVFTFEVQIKTNADRDDITDISAYINDAFKSLRFNLITFTTPTFFEGVYSATYRYRKKIGSNDTL